MGNLFLVVFIVSGAWSTLFFAISYLLRRFISNERDLAFLFTLLACILTMIATAAGFILSLGYVDGLIN